MPAAFKGNLLSMGGRAAKQEKHWKHGSRPAAAIYQLRELEPYLGGMKSVIAKVSSNPKSVLRSLFFFQNLKREASPYSTDSKSGHQGSGLLT